MPARRQVVEGLKIVLPQMWDEISIVNAERVAVVVQNCKATIGLLLQIPIRYYKASARRPVYRIEIKSVV